MMENNKLLGRRLDAIESTNSLVYVGNKVSVKIRSICYRKIRLLFIDQTNVITEQIKNNLMNL